METTNFFNQLMQVINNNHKVTVDPESKMRIQHNLRIIIRGLQDNRTMQLDEQMTGELISALVGSFHYIEESWNLASGFETKLWGQETINLNLNRTINDLRNKLAEYELANKI
jgi:hypothetical protein